MRPAKGATKDKKRVGRGLGSKGTTAGRGQKGQTSRSGVGGLKRLGMRHTLLATPKVRGFNSLEKKVQIVSVGDLSKRFIANEVVTPRTLAKKGMVKDGGAKVKVLSEGDLTVAVTVKNCLVSAGAAEKIAKAGGKVEA
ncbi:MAG: large subunit ribosomal protein [Patescibacteria group bacterium]|jgi:large subunit ribosomal protein L15|nr:large subunit ribosomal protein [Patescibacteria group bacterium]